MSAKEDWALRAKRFLKAELKRRDITYEKLANRLNEMGIKETEGSITIKINRGTFPGWFLLATLSAINCSQIRLDDV
jgi:hypothetical protein